MINIIKIIIPLLIMLQSITTIASPEDELFCSDSVQSPYATSGYMLDDKNNIVIKYTNKFKVYPPGSKYLVKGGFYAEQQHEMTLTNSQFTKLGIESIDFTMHVYNNYDYMDSNGRKEFDFKFDVNQKVKLSGNNSMVLKVRWPKGDKVRLHIRDKYFEDEVSENGYVVFQESQFQTGFGKEYWYFITSLMEPKPNKMDVVYLGRRFSIDQALGGKGYFEKVFKEDFWYQSVLSELNLLKMMKAYINEWCFDD